MAVFNAVRNRPVTIAGTTQSLTSAATAILALNPRGCQQTSVNSFRGGLIVDANGNVIGAAKGRFFNTDLRITKLFKFAERYGLSVYADLYNVFNTDNLALAQRLAISPATAAGNTLRTPTAPVTNTINQASPNFIVPFSLFGPGFGPPVGRPFTAQFGARFTF